MEYGVFTSETLEIARTKFWALCFYCNADKSVIGAKLYNGIDGDMTLAAVCERDIAASKTVYAYEIPGGQRFTNDFDGVCKLLGGKFDYDTAGMLKIDDITLSPEIKMPTVADAGIETCLKLWRMGTSYRHIHNGMMFQMVTNKIEYVFHIRTDDCNIYCGASVNIPYDGGMFGGNQYFRLRNYADNSQPFCRFFCNIGNEIEDIEFDKTVCESGECVTTQQGNYWPVKRYDDDKIVLAGCGGDEYVYNRKSPKSEYFA